MHLPKQPQSKEEKKKTRQTIGNYKRGKKSQKNIKVNGQSSGLSQEASPIHL